MARLWEKMLLYLGLAEEEVEYPQDPGEEQVPEDYKAKSSRKGKVLSIHTTKNQRVIILKPEDFSEAKNIADNLKNRRAVVLNLENSGLENAKRILDFVSGTAYALSCNVQKISDNIFIFTPDNIDLTAEAKKDLTEKGFFTTDESNPF